MISVKTRYQNGIRLTEAGVGRKSEKLQRLECSSEEIASCEGPYILELVAISRAEMMLPFEQQISRTTLKSHPVEYFHAA